MSYSAIDMAYEAPAQSKSVVGALFGAAVGAVVGAVVLASVATVQGSSLYTATATRPAVGVAATIPTTTFAQNRVAAGAAYAAQAASYQGEQQVVMQAPQGIAVYSWAFVICAAIAGAVNGLFLWNSNRRVAMAATTGRREALMAGVAAAGMAASSPAFAAYGENANVFGKPKDVEQYFKIQGNGWSGIMPGKYNPSKEKEYPGQVARWEDNFDAVNNASVIEVNGSLGSIDDVRNNIVTPLLGKQAYEGQSLSEGGFAPGRFSSAAILDQKQETKDGKTYYYYEFLTRTADGNEGGRHQLYVVTAGNGKVLVFKQQAGDKRWFKGLEKPLRKSVAEFRAK